MEKSIKRIEKLVHATNSTLAQMKYSLMFDDLNEGFELGVGKPRKKDGSGPEFFGQEDLRLCQDKFKSETDEMLAKMNKLFGPKEISHKKHSQALERIKEINKKLTTRKSDLPETRQSRQKLLTLINQDLSPASKISGDKPPALKFEKLPTSKDSDKVVPAKSKEELKTKILETQEIIDRGFQAAKELSEKVESMSKNTPSESHAKKSDSSETLKSRCRKCAERRKMKKMKKDKEVGEAKDDNKEVGEVKENNVRIIEVKDASVPTLGIQRLPSLHIKDGLRLQKVHDLEIPACDTCDNLNTANLIITHEGIEKEKQQKEIDQIWLNCLFSDDKSNYVECFNCGKLNKMREVKIDPRKVDDVLRMCNFNVFDPRIDEFVERCITGDWFQEEEPTQDKSIEQTVIEKSHRKTRKLQEMSETLSRLYKQEAEALEDNHLRLDNILQSLFRRLDKSREVFEECLLKRGTRNLGITKPVTISMDSSRKRMDKKDVKNRSKSRTPSSDEVKPGTSSGSTSAEEPKFLLSERPTETFQKRERDKKEQPIPSNSSNDVKPSKSNRKPSITILNGSRRSKKIFRKSGKSIRKTSIQKTARMPACVKSPEMEDKSLLSTSSSITSKIIPTSSKISELQKLALGNFKQLEAFSEKPEIEENTLALERQILTKDSTFIQPLDPSFKKPDSPVSQPVDLKPETEKSLSSSGSGTIKKPEAKLTSPKSEKSENYESDFEGDSEPEVNHKLSTIVEVDSEREKKQTTPSQNTTPTELVCSLKEILSALKDQFTRTETLAEKLTENIQEEKDSPKLWPSDSELVINLQSARKDPKDTRLFKSPFSLVNSSTNRKSDDLSMGSVSEDGSSIGEIITRRKSDSTISENLASGRRWSKVSSGRRDGIPFKPGLNDKVSFSEGEIPSNILVDSEANSTRSIGEVASEKTSEASGID